MSENRRDNSTIRAILLGIASKRQMGIYFFSFLIYLITMWLIAQSFYPGGFSILNEYISGQGDPTDNPSGYLFFIFGAGITGIALIPLYIYLYRRFLPTLKLLTRFFLLFGIISSIGLSIVGWFPRNTMFDLMHDIGADMAFFGAGLAAFSVMIILIRKMNQKTGWPRLYQFLGVYGAVFGLGTWIPFQYNSYLTQWTGFFILLIWMVGIYLLVPDEHFGDEMQ